MATLAPDTRLSRKEITEKYAEKTVVRMHTVELWDE
jgi:hypothetical protein